MAPAAHPNELPEFLAVDGLPQREQARNLRRQGRILIHHRQVPRLVYLNNAQHGPRRVGQVGTPVGPVGAGRTDHAPGNKKPACGVWRGAAYIRTRTLIAQQAPRGARAGEHVCERRLGRGLGRGWWLAASGARAGGRHSP